MIWNSWGGIRGVASLFSTIGAGDGRGCCSQLGFAGTAGRRSSAGCQAVRSLRPVGGGTTKAYANGFTAPLGLMILTKGGVCLRTARTICPRPFVNASICSEAVSFALEK